MSLTLVVLAAGIGSRYGGLKQMDPFGPSGEFILDYSVYDAIRAGFDKVVFVIRHDIEKDFRSIMGHRMERRIAASYVYQELTGLPAGFVLPADRKKPWGTGHAVLAAAPAVKGPFAAINADDFYGRESLRILAEFLRSTAREANSYSMVGFVLRNTVSEHGTVARGICTSGSDGLLQSVVERTRIEKTASGIRYQDASGTWVGMTGGEVVSMNMWGFKESFFGHLRTGFPAFLRQYGQDAKAEYFVPTVVNDILVRRQATVRVLETTSSWFGVTHPEDKPKVVAAINKLVTDGSYPRNLWA